MSRPIAIILLLAISFVLADHSGQVLDRDDADAVRGTKHLDSRDSEQIAHHDGKNLDNKGTDKSNTNTQAVLTATMNAKDQHQDSYSHLHDNAHETDAAGEGDHLQGNEAFVGMHNGADSFGHIDSAHYEHDHRDEDPMFHGHHGMFDGDGVYNFDEEHMHDFGVDPAYAHGFGDPDFHHWRHGNDHRMLDAWGRPRVDDYQYPGAVAFDNAHHRGAHHL